jgi:hypothetical protein
MGVKVKHHRGAFWVFVNHHGQRVARKIGSKEAATKAAAKIQLGLVDGEAADKAVANLDGRSAVPLFSDYAELWLTEAIRPHRKARTEDYYRQIVENHLTPIFGRLPLDGIKPASVRAFIAAKLAGEPCAKHDAHARDCGACVVPLARNTVKNIAATLRAVLYQAQGDSLIASNPAARFGRMFNARHDAREHIMALESEGVASVLNREVVPRPRARGPRAVLYRHAGGRTAGVAVGGYRLASEPDRPPADRGISQRPADREHAQERQTTDRGRPEIDDRRAP